jgi:hypothetical protein
MWAGYPTTAGVPHTRRFSTSSVGSNAGIADGEAAQWCRLNGNIEVKARVSINQDYIAPI